MRKISYGLPRIFFFFYLFYNFIILDFCNTLKSVIQSNTSSPWAKEKGAVLKGITTSTQGQDFLLRTEKNPLTEAFKARKIITVVERFLPKAAEDKVFNLGSSSQSYLNYTCIFSAFFPTGKNQDH